MLFLTEIDRIYATYEIASSLKALDINLGAEDRARLDAVSPPGGAVSSFYNTDPANFAPHPHRF
jgi:hypothetical protein